MPPAWHAPQPCEGGGGRGEGGGEGGGRREEGGGRSRSVSIQGSP